MPHRDEQGSQSLCPNGAHSEVVKTDGKPVNAQLDAHFKVW